MKFKTTRKAILDNCANVKSAGYCSLHFLLRTREPIAYNCGVYGWNFDVYDVYGVVICTGYRNMPGEKLTGIEEYEKRAREIWETRNITYDVQCDMIEKLLYEFCELNGGV